MPRTEGAERWKAMNEPLIAQFRAAGRRLKRIDNQVASMPFFDGYRKRVKAREIPVVAFELVGEEGLEPSRRSRGTGS